MLATYFGALGDNLATALALPVPGLHVDLVRAPEQLDAVLAGARPDLLLSLGVIDGRNIWKRRPEANCSIESSPIAAPASVWPDRCRTSCSLLHTPIDLDARPNSIPR